MSKIINIPRLWYPGVEQPDTNPHNTYSYDSMLKYSNQKPLSSYQSQPFLFLIGQAGSGKSTYLKTYYKPKPDFLYIDIKNLGAMFIHELKNDEKWLNFTDNKNIDIEYFTILLDGWDELIEEPLARKQLIQTLSKVDEGLRSKLRVRIACRPEIPEKDILENLYEDCKWLIPNLNNVDIYRILLSSLCSDQIRDVYENFIPNKSLAKFWEWCVHKDVLTLTGHIQTLLFLVKSFEQDDNNTWKSLPELWEEILFQKVRDVNQRNIDQKRIEQIFTRSQRLNCLGDLAIYHLFNERKPIPHIDRSNDIFGLPAFQIGNGVQWPTIQFLLSSPIFTPGGIDNIHFAQAQEAEFLAARRIIYAKIGLDNLKGLFIVENSVPKHLKGLCKWVAKFDSEWREYLFKFSPNITVASLDILVDSTTRARLIKDWWFDSKSFLRDWDVLSLIPDLLEGTDIKWIEEEIKEQCKYKNEQKLETLLHLIDQFLIKSPTLECLSDILVGLSEESDLYMKILQILSKNQFGDLLFWLNESKKDNRFKGGEKIPFIVKRLKELDSPLKTQLQTFKPVGDYSHHYHYTDFLKNYFETISFQDIHTALNWLNQQDLRGNSDLFWLYGAVNGFLKNLFSNSKAQEFLIIAQKTWSEYDSVQHFFVKDEKIDKIITEEFRDQLFNMLLENNSFLKSYNHRGYYKDQWLFPDGKLDKVLKKFQTELYAYGYTEYAQDLLYLANWKRHLLVQHLEKLSECREWLIKADLFENSTLECITGPWKIDSKRAIDAKNNYMEDLEWKNKDLKREKITEENYKKANEFFLNDFEKVAKYSWYECYNFLTYGYRWYKEGNYGPFPIEYIGGEFWYQRLPEGVRKTIIEKATTFLLNFEWNTEWEKDFYEKQTGSSYTTHTFTIAPFFAWQMLLKILGRTEFENQFSRIDKNLWLKYLWTYSSYHLEILEKNDYLFLLNEADESHLHSVWESVQTLLGESAHIHKVFLEIESEVMRSFLNTLLVKPFAIPIGDTFLSHYLQENGATLCNDWFSKWFTKNQTLESNEILFSSEFRFFIQHFVAAAWNYLTKHLVLEKLEELFEWYALDRHKHYSQLVKSWDKQILEDIIVFFYNHFHPETDQKQDGVYEPDWRDEISGVRNILLDYVFERPSSEAEKIYRTLKQKISNFDSTRHIEQILQEKKCENSIRLGIIDIATLLSANGIKVLKSNEELTEWIITLLSEFEDNVLNGQNGIHRLLWDEPVGRCPTSKPEPKHEEAFSDLLYQWFQWRKQNNPIIASRELQISRKSIRDNDPNSVETGQRLDIHLWFKSTKKDLQTVVETKKFTNPELANGEGIKKLKGYLDRLHINTGIFLIEHWNGTGKTKNEIFDLINPQIQQLKTEGYKIYPFIISIK